jgi:alanine dehydrogenase
MKIGVPKEIKPQENRIGLTPESVKTLTSNGHKVLIENNGGFEAGFENDQYIKAGAMIAEKAEDIFNDSDIIVKDILSFFCYHSTCFYVLIIFKPGFKPTIIFN